MNPVPVLIDHFDSVVQITLNRPNQRNALNDTLVDSLGSALEHIATTDECRARRHHWGWLRILRGRRHDGKQ